MEPMEATSTHSNTGVCNCGCGTATAKSFAPGHDARFYGYCLRGENGFTTEDLAPYPGLMRKLANRGTSSAARKIQPIKATAEIDAEGFLDVAPPAPSGHWAEPDPSPQAFAELKVGRWWYEAKTVTAVGNDLFDVEWKAKNGNVRTSRVGADKLR